MQKVVATTHRAASMAATIRNLILTIPSRGFSSLEFMRLGLT